MKKRRRRMMTLIPKNLLSLKKRQRAIPRTMNPMKSTINNFKIIVI